MIKHTKKHLMLLAFAAAGLSAPAVQAADEITDIVVNPAGEIPYVIDARNVVARSDFGLCWRTGYWTPAAAEQALADNDLPVGCACEGDVIEAAKCAPPVAETPAAPPAVAQKIKLSADALFDFDKAVLKPTGKQMLDELATKLDQINLEVILAVGHTDRIGSAAYNQRLSERRAAAVKTYLANKGVPSQAIYTEGKGKTHPVTGDKCNGIKNRKALISCLQPDRRVEIEVIGTTKGQ